MSSNFEDGRNSHSSETNADINTGDTEVQIGGKKTILIDPSKDFEYAQLATKYFAKRLQKYFPETFDYFIKRIKKLPINERGFTYPTFKGQLIEKMIFERSSEADKDALSMAYYLLNNTEKEHPAYEHNDLLLSLSFLINVLNHSNILDEIDEQREYYLDPEPVTATSSKFSDGYFCNLKVEEEFLPMENLIDILENFLMYQVIIYHVDDSYFIDNLLADIRIVESNIDSHGKTSSFNYFESLVLDKLEKLIDDNYEAICTTINVVSSHSGGV